MIFPKSLSVSKHSKEREMKKTILTFGLISGAISTLMMVATVPFAHKIGFDKALIIGYTNIILSFLLVFFGIRSFRDNVGNGQITFVRGFTVGILITLISCLCYVATWEVLYFKFMPDFMDTYVAHMVEQVKASGATAAQIQKQIEDLNKFKVDYKNPFYNAAMTFIEPFPVGLVITLLSAAVLRRKQPGQPAQSPLPASS